MVYKRYIKRDGKVFGPYYYESYRDKKGNVKTRFISGPKTNDKSSNKKLIYILLVATFTILFVSSVLISLNKNKFNKQNEYYSGKGLLNSLGNLLSLKSINNMIFFETASITENGYGSCNKNSDCNDRNGCTIDSCKEGVCSFILDNSIPECNIQNEINDQVPIIQNEIDNRVPISDIVCNCELFYSLVDLETSDYGVEKCICEANVKATKRLGELFSGKPGLEEPKECYYRDDGKLEPLSDCQEEVELPIITKIPGQETVRISKSDGEIASTLRYIKGSEEFPPQLDIDLLPKN